MSEIYKMIISAVDKFVPRNLRPIWEHEAGPKTIFFWAPAFKWVLVLASIGDINRPVEKLSIFQCASLAMTGLIWTRYSLVMKPKNYSLLTVNVFIAVTNLYHIGRAFKYQYEMND